LRLHSKTRISLLATMELPRIAAALTKTMRVLMKTSRPTPNPKLAKNSTQTTKAVAQTAMLKWVTRTVMLLKQQCQNAQRRSRKRNDRPASHRRVW
jgi:23S rRNA maturation mini-RNase III